MINKFLWDFVDFNLKFRMESTNSLSIELPPGTEVPALSAAKEVSPIFIFNLNFQPNQLEKKTTRFP